FKDKKNMNRQGEEQGYNYSRLWLNDYLKTIDNWTIENYNERFDLIYSRFLNIWKYPDVVAPVSENTEETLFNAEAPTYKKLEYFIFENTKVDEEIIARMYFYVIEKLYDKNPQLLLEAKEILKITRNESDFRVAQGLQNGYFVESNIGSDAKFNILKKLLTLFELEDELIIKYGDSHSIGGSSPSRFNLRKEFWRQLLPLIRNTELFSNVNPSKDHWLSAGAGVSGVSYTFVVTGNYARIELGIITSSKETNKKHFRTLYNQKDSIETAFGNQLEWEELPDNKMSRIKYELKGVNLFDRADWERMNEFLVKYLPKFELALQPTIQRLR
ncbi:MAG: DUF4268 domain-containing protein, partial [Gelidibacter sp.]